jgi:hypothetical protein
MDDDQKSTHDKIMQAVMKALNEAAEKAQQMKAKESSDRFVQQAMENLRQAAREARQTEEAENRYQRLSKEEWDAVAEDLKEHLKLTELLSRPTKGMKIQ